MTLHLHVYVYVLHSVRWLRCSRYVDHRLHEGPVEVEELMRVRLFLALARAIVLSRVLSSVRAHVLVRVLARDLARDLARVKGLQLF